MDILKCKDIGKQQNNEKKTRNKTLRIDKYAVETMGDRKMARKIYKL